MVNYAHSISSITLSSLTFSSSTTRLLSLPESRAWSYKGRVQCCPHLALCFELVSQISVCWPAEGKLNSLDFLKLFTSLAIHLLRWGYKNQYIHPRFSGNEGIILFRILPYTTTHFHRVTSYIFWIEAIGTISAPTVSDGPVGYLIIIHFIKLIELE